MQLKKEQIFAITACLGLGVSLFIWGAKVSPSKDASNTTKESVSFSWENYQKTQKASLNQEEQSGLDSLENQLTKSGSSKTSTAVFRLLADFWEKKSNWAMSAYYLDKLAVNSREPEAWEMAGSRYLAASEMENDSTSRKFLASESLRTLNQAVKLAPGNLDLQAELGNATAVLSESPMEGIQLLLGVVRKDSLHLKANYHLGQLAIRSGQLDKAIGRFSLITKNYPDFPDAYLGLGEVYYNQGKRNEAEKALQTYKALVRDPAVIKQVDAFFEQIRTEKP